MLHEDDARRGFFEKDEFESVAAALPIALAEVARFPYLSEAGGKARSFRWNGRTWTALRER